MQSTVEHSSLCCGRVKYLSLQHQNQQENGGSRNCFDFLIGLTCQRHNHSSTHSEQYHSAVNGYTCNCTGGPLAGRSESHTGGAALSVDAKSLSVSSASHDDLSQSSSFTDPDVHSASVE